MSLHIPVLLFVALAVNGIQSAHIPIGDGTKLTLRAIATKLDLIKETATRQKRLMENDMFAIFGYNEYLAQCDPTTTREQYGNAEPNIRNSKIIDNIIHEIENEADSITKAAERRKNLIKQLETHVNEKIRLDNIICSSRSMSTRGRPYFPPDTTPLLRRMDISTRERRNIQAESTNVPRMKTTTKSNDIPNTKREPIDDEDITTTIKRFIYYTTTQNVKLPDKTTLAERNSFVTEAITLTPKTSKRNPITDDQDIITKNPKITVKTTTEQTGFKFLTTKAEVRNRDVTSDQPIYIPAGSDKPKVEVGSTKSPSFIDSSDDIRRTNKPTSIPRGSDKPKVDVGSTKSPSFIDSSDDIRRTNKPTQPIGIPG
jgi:hypothetical protein